jgi:chromosome condensin MukBEF complex kleisin-like MukF subunit
MALKISESAAVQMPMKTVASLIAMIAVGTWAYFGIHEKLSQSAGEAELFMIVEHVSGLLEDVEEEIKGMRNNAVNIEFLKKRTEKLTEDVEKLIRNGSGH